MAPIPPDLTTNHLKPGEKSDRVKTWQHVLNNRGFVLTITGVFDKPTESATHVAEHTCGLATYQTVGPAVWTAVNNMPLRPPTKVPITLPRLTLKVIDVRQGQHDFVRHPDRHWEKRNWGGVRGVLGHYTGGPGTFQADARFHVQSDYLTKGGAPAIAYHLGIDYNGDCYVFNNHDDLTWHCDGGQNAVWVGVVFRGAEGGMTLAQRRAMRLLMKKLKDGGIVPGWPKLLNTRSTVHQEVNSTSCPGVAGRSQYLAIFAQNGLKFWPKPPRP